MTLAHDIRGRLHAARLNWTFVERALARSCNDPELLEAVVASSDELRELERLVLALLGDPAPSTGSQT